MCYNYGMRSKNINKSISSSLFGLLIIGVIVTGLWFESSPWSPLLTAKISHHVVNGQEAQAIKLLLWQSEHALTEHQENDSLWKAAILASLHSENTDQARDLLQRCIERPNFPHISEAYARLAILVAEPMPRKAAEYWQLAIQANPDHKLVAQWWINVANIYEMIDRPVEAIDAWEHVMAYDDNISIARISLGRLQLNIDPDIALQHFYTLKGHDMEGKTATLGTQLALWEMERQGVLADGDADD